MSTRPPSGDGSKALSSALRRLLDEAPGASEDASEFLLREGLTSARRIGVVLDAGLLSSEGVAELLVVVGALGGPSSLASRICTLAESVDPLIALLAVDALREIGTETAGRCLARRVREERRSDVRERAINALGMMRYRPAEKLMLRILRNENEPARARDHAAETLGYLESENAIAALLEAGRAEADDDLFDSIIFALERIRGHRAREATENLLSWRNLQPRGEA